MINIEKLQVKYGDFTALDVREPIVINKGDRIGIIGSNGAGKTTFIKAVLGLIKYSGKIVTELKFSDMAVHMQENNYVASVAVKYIIEAVLDTDIRKNQKLKDLIDFFDFSKCLNKKYQQLSGGQKQRMTIILVLMQNAPITFFDEVTSGLDFETREALMSKIVEWYKNTDNALGIVSHYYEELQELTDKLLIIDKGQVAAFGKTTELFERFCGKVIMIIDNNEKNRILTADLPQTAAPDHLLAFPCNNTADEINIATKLSENDVNYKRSTIDLEILFASAVKHMRNRGASK